MPRSEKQYKQIREEKRELILNTALELFAQQGFHSTSIEQIAKKAGISKGLTYNYFESKKSILDEILKTGFDAIYANFDLNKDGILTYEEFEFFIRKSFAVMTENRSFWKLYFSLMMQPVVTEAYMNDYREASVNLYNILIRFLTDIGSTDAQKDILIVSSLLKGTYLIIVTSPGFADEEKYVDTILEGFQRIINHKNN
ncbi:MAG: TetR/AcrR family transcriptional regulator [Draconibacterium sp.]